MMLSGIQSKQYLVALHGVVWIQMKPWRCMYTNETGFSTKGDHSIQCLSLRSDGMQEAIEQYNTKVMLPKELWLNCTEQLKNVVEN